MQPWMGSAVCFTYVTAGNANLLVGHEQAARETQTVFMELFCSFWHRIAALGCIQS